MERFIDLGVYQRIVKIRDLRYKMLANIKHSSFSNLIFFSQLIDRFKLIGKWTQAEKHDKKRQFFTDLLQNTRFFSILKLLVISRSFKSFRSKSLLLSFFSIYAAII